MAMERVTGVPRGQAERRHANETMSLNTTIAVADRVQAHVNDRVEGHVENA